jgi:hypothetical protein
LKGGGQDGQGHLFDKIGGCFVCQSKIIMPFSRTRLILSGAFFVA